MRWIENKPLDSCEPQFCCLRSHMPDKQIIILLPGTEMGLNLLFYFKTELYKVYIYHV